MKIPETLPSASSYVGHVRNGVIVPDANFALTEGLAVRFEPLEQELVTPISDERADQLQQMQKLFAQWDEEDSNISDEDAESFHQALEQNRGLSFRIPQLD